MTDTPRGIFGSEAWAKWTEHIRRDFDTAPTDWKAKTLAAARRYPMGDRLAVAAVLLGALLASRSRAIAGTPSPHHDANYARRALQAADALLAEVTEQHAEAMARAEREDC